MIQILFFLPFVYTFTTRLNDRKKRIAWCFTYIIPVFMAFAYIMPENIGHNIIYFIMSILVIYSAYELGYFYNDAELIKKEDKPTLRLNLEQMIFYQKYRGFIYCIRVVLITILCMAMVQLNYEIGISLILAVSIILITYVFYNSTRSKWNIPLYSFLVFIRYFGIFIYFTSIKSLFYLWLAYPLCVTIEFMSKPRFKIPLYLVKNNTDLFRVYYYIVLSFLLLLMNYKDCVPFFINLIVGYFFFFRTLTYFTVSKKYRGVN